jgi:hypothetical protein
VWCHVAQAWATTWPRHGLPHGTLVYDKNHLESMGVEPRTSPLMESFLEKAAQLERPYIGSYHITFPHLFKIVYGIVWGWVQYGD